ncbi:unnamed protein product [Cyclocybe aegerita]|uniref:Major facilitator superfamily (MFS) profile domain-containing protein n=1 Tax=Cyclocybe aegerita TaxID=1973307 RepID=A0A8S0XVY7_CYCAE|nr:unnamed protein product [Cyclocybe aegerita]
MVGIPKKSTTFCQTSSKFSSSLVYRAHPQIRYSASHSDFDSDHDPKILRQPCNKRSSQLFLSIDPTTSRIPPGRVMVQHRSPIVEDDEQTPLLAAVDGGQAIRVGRSRSGSRERRRFSPTTLIAPIAIICRLALLLPSTTNFLISQGAACRLWYLLHDPSSIPPIGRIPDELCEIPEVDKYYAAFLSVLAALDGVGTVVGCGAASYFAGKVGRKPVLLTFLVLGIAAQSFVMVSQLAQGWMQLLFLGLWVLSQTLSNPITTIFVINTYIVDVVRAEDRTAALSRIAGWSSLGGALSFSLGGTITTQTGSMIAIYIVGVSFLVAICLYIAFILPESFPASKREELQRQRTDGGHGIKVVFEPLKRLVPTYDADVGRYNNRLFYCAIHILLVSLADSYAVVGMILYFTTQYKYTPAQTGYVLTTLSLTGVFVLTALIPVIVRVLKPFYARKQDPTPIDRPTSDSSSDGSGNEEEEDAQAQVVSETSDHMDVHITIVSWGVEALAYIVVGMTSTIATQLASVVCIGLGAGRTPVFRSLVVSSVDPLKQGEALAAIEMVSSVGMILSPIVMGSVVTATIASAPRTLFYVHAAIIIVGSSVLFLIRDSDRYKKPPHEELRLHTD